MSAKCTRRKFIASASTFSILPRRIFAQAGRPGANGRLSVAGIGIGGMGKGNLKRIAEAGHQVVALCDVDRAYAAPVVAQYPGAVFFTDFRELFERQKDLDAVMIATPDHTHALIASAAMKAGKHVFVQKPLCHDIFECRELA
ncbi:MAG: Gfo/Idh/MocA family oxidoreductase, partial [Kiritimatiellae bacterium]|nr:Gfo/Idh/MocA family oxidoreductase [Kiritimatiellia bacterium]